ncbi:nuclear transport factor 2 family protein [Bosea sp. TND4EK4]|uniref:nuclear transport factor 2 family protein n=1 Tax=Bosea sp. TND4EK4 TaxID=1907408 RepID=UPI000955FAF8|nr:nuclear transport factor 2 family protein [Bosea sp. TND4EK4]SIQ76646.1 SnoaL-like domain-containing protein [Bosea sp. TND4EK4]
MDLPNCIAAYFEADSRNDVEALMATLSPEAIVEDEHRRHVGPEAIRAWWIEAKRKTPHVNAPIEATTTGDVTQVRTRVSGDFPGSPVALLFTFTVRNGAIARLEIA